MTPEQLTALISQLGISLIFVWAWNNERIERQRIQADKDKVIEQIRADKDLAIAELNSKMMAMQTQHRAEVMEMLHNWTQPRFQAMPPNGGQVAA